MAYLAEDTMSVPHAARSRPDPAIERPASRRTGPRAPRDLPRCPEIDCVRHLLPPAAVAIAELRAAELGVGADRVLIARGLITEEAYLLALCTSLRIPFEPMDHIERNTCPLTDAQLLEAAGAGLLPLNADIDGQSKLVIVPRLVDSRRLVAAVRSGTELARRLRFTSLARLQRFAAAHGANELSRRAAHSLRLTQPELSAGTRKPWPWMLAVFAALGAFGVIAAPDYALLALELTFGAIFVAWGGLRLMGIASEGPTRLRPQNIADAKLPIYTIIVALYREASAVKDLVAAIRRFDYPPEKLDVKLVLEADDESTRKAVDDLQLPATFEVIVAPNVGPRTKPKALNAALAFARGSFIAVYDAEDQPDPGQLRQALDAFVTGHERLACVQARLTIDNSADSWLARVFTAEYAGLFDVFLPSLAAWQVPLPLGGSSNHFRTLVLRRIGGWDPYNVTEDADLGMRLARCGYRTTVIPSTTYEEAPARFGAWLRQRTRWFKGWLQTWLVHMRSPRRVMRELGVKSFLVFQLLVGGTVLAALVHVIFAIGLAHDLIRGIQGESAADVAFSLHVVTLLTGYLTSGALAMIGLARRRLMGYAWALLFIPLYWLLLSIAAWRALFQLIGDPYRWEKTEHGLARTSRLAAKLEAADSRPQQTSSAIPATDSAASPQPHPAAAA